MAKEIATIKGLVEIELIMIVNKGSSIPTLKNVVTDTIRSALHNLQDIYGDPYTVEYGSFSVEYENPELARPSEYRSPN